MDKLRQWEKETTEVREKLLELKKDLFKGDEKNVVKQFPADAQEMYYKKPEERTTHEQQLVEMVNRQVRHKWVRTKWDKKLTKKEELKKKYEDLNHQLASFSPKPSLHQAFVTTDLSVRPARTFIPGKKKRETFPEFLSLLKLPAPKIKETEHGTTGRRLALANWITSPENPLSTRVIVNRVWQKHFGKGLVGSANDFGFLGEEPSHPELLIGWPPHSSKGVGNSKIFTVRSCSVTPMVRPPAASPRKRKSKRSRKPSSLALPASTAFRRTNPGCHARRFR